MTPRIIILTRSFGAGKGRSEGALERACLKGCSADFKQLSDILGPSDAEGIIVGTDYIGEEVLKLFPKLKCAVKFGVGVDNINVGECSTRGVYVAKLEAGINSATVAEFAFSLMLSAARTIASSDRDMKSCRWNRVVGTNLFGKTVGIIGTGAIGLKLTEFLSGFNVRLLGYDAFKNAQFCEKGGVYVSFDELLREADFISVHLPLNDATRGIVGEREMSIMKKGAIIINTSRGGVVDEKALLKALEEGRIGGAALDVFSKEPPTDWDLASHPKVVATPHVAAYTVETLEKMEDAAISVALSLIGGQPTATTLNPELPR